MNVTLPNGKKIRNVPEGTPKLEIAQKAIAAGLATAEDFGGFVPEPWTPKEPARQKQYVEGALQQGLQGATLGTSDEIQAGVGALSTIGQTDMPFLERFKTIRDQLRQEKKQYLDDVGAIGYVPEVTAGIAAGIGGLVKNAATYPGAMAVGATEGAIAGTGYADADDFLSGDTALGTGVGAVGGTVGGLVGLAAGRGIKKGGEMIAEGVKSRFPNLTRQSQRIARETAEAAEMGSPTAPDTAAQYIQTKSGKLVRDPLYSVAKAQKIPDQTINAVKGLSPSDKKAMLQALNIIRIGKRSPGFWERVRPGGPLGDTVKQKIDFISGVRRKAGKQLDALVKTRLKGQPVPVDDELQSFVASLDEFGVDYAEKKGGKVALDFSESRVLTEADRPRLKEVFRQFNVMLKDGRPTADQVHDLKRAIANQIYSKPTDKMSPEGLKMLEDLRAGLNERLRETFDGYREINKVLEDTISAMDEISTSLGRKYNPDSPNADEYIGNELRKLASRYGKRTELIDTLNKVQEVSQKYGMQSDADIFRQASMVNQMEELFGSTATRDFRSETGKGTRDALESITRGNQGDAARHLLGPMLDALEGVEEEKAIKVLMDMLNR